MISNTIMRFGDVSPGTNVRVPIDSVDRGKTDPRNFIAVVLENKDGRYKLGVPTGKQYIYEKILNSFIGMLPQHFPRTSFVPTGTNNLSISDIPSCSTTVRSASRAVSVHGGQGFKSCGCMKGCGNSCGCRKNGRVCNSKCHNGLKSMCQNI